MSSFFQGLARKRKPAWRTLLVWVILGVAAYLSSRAVAFMLVPDTVPGGRAPAGKAASAAAGTGASSQAAAPARVDTSAIDGNNLMALKTHGAKAAPVAPPPPPPPSFSAALLGTMGSFDEAGARAIVLFQGQQHVLRPGESLAGFTLVSVSRGEAVFQGFGQDVSLALDKPDAPRPVILP